MNLYKLLNVIEETYLSDIFPEDVPLKTALSFNAFEVAFKTILACEVAKHYAVEDMYDTFRNINELPDDDYEVVEDDMDASV